MYVSEQLVAGRQSKTFVTTAATATADNKLVCSRKDYKHPTAGANMKRLHAALSIHKIAVPAWSPDGKSARSLQAS